MPYHTVRFYGGKKYVVNVCDYSGTVHHKDYIGYTSVYHDNKWFGSYNDMYEYKYGKSKIKENLIEIPVEIKIMIIEDIKIIRKGKIREIKNEEKTVETPEEAKVETPEEAKVETPLQRKQKLKLHKDKNYLFLKSSIPSLTISNAFSLLIKFPTLDHFFESLSL